MPNLSPLGLIVPTRWEAGPILRRFPFRLKGRDFFEASIQGRRVLLYRSGVGAEAARRAADQLVAKGAKELISLGFCGALVPELNVGDLLTDRIISVQTPARTPAERQALTQRANARGVDMETQAIIEAGTFRGVPIRILRVVSDTMEDDLTPLFGSSGEFSMVGIALRLLNPSVWPLAMKLRRQSALAGQKLADALQSFLAAS